MITEVLFTIEGDLKGSRLDFWIYLDDLTLEEKIDKINQNIIRYKKVLVNLGNIEDSLNELKALSKP